MISKARKPSQWVGENSNLELKERDHLTTLLKEYESYFTMLRRECTLEERRYWTTRTLQLIQEDHEMKGKNHNQQEEEKQKKIDEEEEDDIGHEEESKGSSFFFDFSSSLPTAFSEHIPSPSDWWGNLVTMVVGTDFGKIAMNEIIERREDNENNILQSTNNKSQGLEKEEDIQTLK